jgi:hypothetical protein
VYGSSSLLSSLKSSGVLEGGASLLGSVATAAIASKVGHWFGWGRQIAKETQKDHLAEGV